MGLSKAFFHARMIKRHAWKLTKELLGIRDPPRTDFSCTTAVFHMPNPAHPAATCRCSCGHEASASDHDAGCVWGQSMCQDCQGAGYCCRCGGDGIDPEAPASAYQHAEEA